MDADARRQYSCLGQVGQGKTACPSGKQFLFKSYKVIKSKDPIYRTFCSKPKYFYPAQRDDIV